MKHFKIKILGILLLACPLINRACTMYKLTKDGKTIVGNNEDYLSPNSQFWFEAGSKDTYGVMYMGLLNTLLPKALGGKPEFAQKSFERAIELSKGRNLMVKVHYAERYARLVFDQELHDKLLTEVLNAEVRAHRLTLVNTLAKIKAKELLASGKEYF